MNNEMNGNAWQGFATGTWQREIDVRDFIQKNYLPYTGDGEFLAGPTKRTSKLWEKCCDLLKQEKDAGGVLAVDADTVIDATSFGPGYIEQASEIIVGLQTDQPLKRAVNPFGGIRMAKDACKAYGAVLNPVIEHAFTAYRKTHNQGVFDAYTDDVKRARKFAVITGLPDAYGRGRIIGDYRRTALYGTEFLIAGKRRDLQELGNSPLDEDTIRLREEAAEQIRALEDLTKMAAAYGFDLARSAENAREAIQWLYFSYLGAIKEQNGAAMSLGRISTFLDIYIARDIARGVLDEEQAQELIDDFVIKLRLARHLRTPEYNELFAGDPMWITECLGGMGEDGRPLVTKSSFRMLHTLYNIGSAPEPNLTVLWSDRLPEAFKLFCAQVSNDTNAIQYENDELMRPLHGDDYGIACCVSAMTIGKQMQFFGARCNIAKTLLLAINAGKDEFTGQEVIPGLAVMDDEYLDYGTVVASFEKAQQWVCRNYVDALNVIHYMHDKYDYERMQMALHDTHVERLMAFGLAGLSVIADSLSAIKYAKVRPLRNEQGIAVDFAIEGEYPAYGNDDDRVDDIAKQVVRGFREEIGRYPLYRQAKPTLSILTITSNVVYGKKTGATPDGRKARVPFAPGANPMSGREKRGTLAWLNSVAKLPYSVCRDGISCTLNLVPQGLSKERAGRISKLSAILDGYFLGKGHHLNVNIISRETLLEAMADPDSFPHLTIRVSGYAVHFNRLTKEQKAEVISRAYHNGL